MSTLLFLLSFLSAVGYGQSLTAEEVFNRMEKTISGIKTLRYTSRTTALNSGRTDSLENYTAECWLEVKPADTIFGAHLHVRQKYEGGASDYYYDGSHGIDVWHRSKDSQATRSVTVIEPNPLPSGINQVQTRMSLIPYFDELIGKHRMKTWKKLAAQWKVSDKGDVLVMNYMKTSGSVHQEQTLVIDRNSMLLREFHELVEFNGVRYKTDKIISNIQLNDPSILQGVYLVEDYSAYRYIYEEKIAGNNAKKEPSALLNSSYKDFAGLTLDGAKTTLGDQRGKLTVIDFWETWCTYCILSMPKVNSLYERFKSKGLNIIGVFTENEEKIRQIAGRRNLKYPNMLVSKEVLKLYSVTARPRYLLIDEKGMIIADGSFDEITAVVERRL